MGTVAERSNKGFTIVELLIVIVVIAILAAITIVAYNGIQNQAKASAAQAAAKQALTKIQAYAVQNADQYPATIAAAGLTSSGGTTYQYRVDNSANPKTFCLTTTTQEKSYYVSSSSGSPMAGACNGHAVDGGEVVTNLVPNPNSESVGLVLNNGGGATAVRTTADRRSGAASTLLTKGSGYAYMNGMGNGITSLATGGEEITFSAWVKSSAPSLLMAKRGAGVAFGTYAKSIPVDTWTRITQTITVDAGATSFYFDIGWEAGSAPSGATLYIDDIMATSGNTVHDFADGNSPGWIWNGTVNRSTSTGPIL